jgi:hypothetical protein
MKILIISNNTRKQDWEPVLKEAKPFLKVLHEEKSVTVTNINIPTPPSEGYNGGQS